MTAVDIGMWAVAMWTCLLLWLPAQAAEMFARLAVGNSVGWYGAMVSLAEASAVKAFVGYVVVYHLFIWGVYWLVRRGRGIAPIGSDVVALVLATMLTVCYVPTFLAGWSMVGVHLELLSPDWLTKFAIRVAGLIGVQGETTDLVFASVLLKTHIVGLPSILYVTGFFGSFKNYKLRKIA
ncbi:hypothetical protein HFO56_02085 [Rhizobium laguerreae]|uniref:hypothetical protein n=1 Tax=Rhizobium laguerreae TaxID=1076926 RepID=UPI001C90284B|nr:hypothetical protein [Rhizobium laguerreae]MBY3151196.1 hypothetical protein [Rhizobium laguerreae]